MADKKKKTSVKDKDWADFDDFGKKKARKKTVASAKKKAAGKKGSIGRKSAKRKKKKKNPLWTWPLMIFSLLILTGIGVMALKEKSQYEAFVVMKETVDQAGFYPGITIDGSDVSGRSFNEVMSSVEAYEKSAQAGLSVTLSCGTDSWTINADELDYSSDYESVIRAAWQVGHEGTVAERYQAIREMQKNGANYTITRGYDLTLLRAITDSVAAELTVDAKDASVVDFSVDTLTFYFDSEKDGTYVDPDALYQAALTAVQSGIGGQTVIVSQQPVYPNVKVSDIEPQLGLIAQARTLAGGTRNRRSNIQVAANRLNGLKLEPGEVFSFNGTIGERTEAAGYKSAGAFSDGLLTEELGGGICQVSTTLFNAIAKADLELIARSPHSRPVTYVDKGKDAAVSWPNQDFKFMNDTPYPIFIVTEYGSDYWLTIQIYGKQLENGVYITIEAQTLEEYQPGDPIYVYTKDLPTGTKQLIEEARTGYYAESYKIYHNADGSEISRELYCRSTYAESGAKYRVGQ